MRYLRVVYAKARKNARLDLLRDYIKRFNSGEQLRVSLKTRRIRNNTIRLYLPDELLWPGKLGSAVTGMLKQHGYSIVKVERVRDYRATVFEWLVIGWQRFARFVCRFTP